MNWKRLRKWLLLIAGIYIAGGIALYFLQDAILFHPVRLKSNHRYDFKELHRDISIPLNKEDTLNLVQFLPDSQKAKGLVLYFHGNKRNIAWYAKYAPYFTSQGYEVIMIDYPGFGKSTGKFTEKVLYEWARQVYRFGRTRYSADSIIIYGKSMGTGIASWLASREDCARLLLETPYYDFPSVIRHYLPIYPVGSLLHYQLPTYHYLEFVKAPISIFHGTEDKVIRFKNARRLMPFLKSTDEFIAIPAAGHNDLYTFPMMVGKLDSLLKR